MAYYYIKLYHEILDDPKMGKMSDRLFRRTIELFLMAGANGRDGILPSLDDISWKLRIQEHILEQDLAELKNLGIVHYNGLSWIVTNFEKRQAAATPAQRMKELRKRRRQENPIVTNELRSVTDGVTNSVQELKLKLESEEEGIDFSEMTIKEALQIPEILIFQQATERTPGESQLQIIYEVIRDFKFTPDDLRKYWTAWTSRKTKKGQPYRRDSLVWLTDWAVSGEIPPATPDEPKSEAYYPDLTGIGSQDD